MKSTERRYYYGEGSLKKFKNISSAVEYLNRCDKLEEKYPYVKIGNELSFVTNIPHRYTFYRTFIEKYNPFSNKYLVIKDAILSLLSLVLTLKFFIIN